VAVDEDVLADVGESCVAERREPQRCLRGDANDRQTVARTRPQQLGLLWLRSTRGTDSDALRWSFLEGRYDGEDETGRGSDTRRPVGAGLR
jgi:hypothetical protein